MAAEYEATLGIYFNTLLASLEPGQSVTIKREADKRSDNYHTYDYDYLVMSDSNHESNVCCPTGDVSIDTMRRVIRQVMGPRSKPNEEV